jgi:hypothetical protein
LDNWLALRPFESFRLIDCTGRGVGHGWRLETPPIEMMMLIKKARGKPLAFSNSSSKKDRRESKPFYPCDSSIYFCPFFFLLITLKPTANAGRSGISMFAITVPRCAGAAAAIEHPSPPWFTDAKQIPMSRSVKS